MDDPIYLEHLVAAPNFSSDLSKFCKPLYDLLAQWARIDTHAIELDLGGSLTLQGGYNQADFVAAIEHLKITSNAILQGQSDIGFARGQRNAALVAIYRRMKQYRAGAAAVLPDHSPALENLPRLTPKAGTTPPALKVEGAWNAVSGQDDLTWEASKAKGVAKIQVRGCVGGTYDADEEEIVADLPADATSWSGDWGLTAPGSRASFKAFVMTTTGNENGGKAVTITRPVG